MDEKLTKQVTEILSKYDPERPKFAADELRNLWLQYEPKSIDVIKAELREQQETNRDTRSDTEINRRGNQQDSPQSS